MISVSQILVWHMQNMLLVAFTISKLDSNFSLQWVLIPKTKLFILYTSDLYSHLLKIVFLAAEGII